MLKAKIFPQGVMTPILLDFDGRCIVVDTGGGGDKRVNGVAFVASAWSLGNKLRHLSPPLLSCQTLWTCLTWNFAQWYLPLPHRGRPWTLPRYSNSWLLVFVCHLWSMFSSRASIETTHIKSAALWWEVSQTHPQHGFQNVKHPLNIANELSTRIEGWQIQYTHLTRMRNIAIREIPWIYHLYHNIGVHIWWIQVMRSLTNGSSHSQIDFKAKLPNLSIWIESANYIGFLS